MSNPDPNPSYSHIGIDVSKATLDLHVFHSAQHRQFPNSTDGHRQLVAFLQPLHPQRIVFEASGGYEKQLLLALVDARLPACRVQPQDVRHYARALKIKAKTDKIDAALLARFARERHDLPVITDLDPDLQALRERVTRREQLIEQQTMEKNRLGQARDRNVLKSIQRHLNHLKREIARVEKDIDSLISSRPDLHARAQKLDETVSVGKATVGALIAYLPEIGHTSDKKLNSLVGVAPYNHDSGPLRGQRHIRGGRRIVRNALYMACISGLTHNHVIRTYYRRLRDAGLAHKSAMMACIRKLISHLNKQLAQLQNPTTQQPQSVAHSP